MDALIAKIIGDIALISAVSALLGALARRWGQPTVIGQVLTGLLLGASVFGRLPGHLAADLFPATVVSYLNVLAQVAVVIFMFTVGYEIEFAAVRGHGRSVPLIAAAALCVPMAGGAGLVLLFRSDFTVLGQQHWGRSFVLFMAVAMAITALPVLAAIVRERGLAGTTVGTIATASAGIMDVLAWLVLAVALIGTGESSRFSWPVTLFLTACLVVVMLALVRPLLAWWLSRPQSVLVDPIPVAFVLALGCAWATGSLGLHPVFGGFLAGLVMRGSRPADHDVLQTMERAGGLLLPLFFVVTGLSLNIEGLRWNGVALLAVILVISCAGKVGPAYGVSRAAGLRPRQSATIAVLINTRGLTELIALNVGLAAGIIDENLFTILVLMALITTFATGPLLRLVLPVPDSRAAAKPAVVGPAPTAPAADQGDPA